ncbi:IS3 family transposase, partial [Streptococcus danieliae]|uniref:IS3 family transposase n=1 Tax=Streptococcus danieliae TaxID=747656 RepID=UPI001F018E9F
SEDTFSKINSVCHKTSISYTVYKLNNYNGMMESFFGVLKTEMFYGYESSFKSIDELIQAISDYYNNKRIKTKLKGLSPVQYRIQSFQ